MEEGQRIKDAVRKQYAKIALGGNSGCACMPGECCTADNSFLPEKAAEAVGYDSGEISSIPKESILGVGCGAPLNFANPTLGEIVVDLGSGAGIDAFLSAKRVGALGRVIGIDMTDEMLEKSIRIAKTEGYGNVEFRKGDIEQHIPVFDGTADLVISNCVINLTNDKQKAFEQAHRVLKRGGRMVISDLVTDKQVQGIALSEEKWCSCIDGALTKEAYLDSIRRAGFAQVEVLQERVYLEGKQVDGRKISSLIVRAIKP